MNAFSVGKCLIYDAVNMIHDVIITANPSLYTAKFMFVHNTLRNKVSTNQTLKDKKDMHIELPYIKNIKLGWEK